MAWYWRFSVSGVGTPASRQNSSSVRIADLRAIGVQLLGLFQLLAPHVASPPAAPTPESFRADHHHRRLRIDVVGGGAAEARHQRARVLAAERAQLSR